MAATTSFPRPVSFFEPSTSTQPSSLDQLTPLRRPRSPVTSHYRPYSIFIAEPSPEPRRRSILRSPSLMNIGLHFLDWTKEKEKEKGKGKGKEKDRGKAPKTCNAFPDRLEPPLGAITSSPKHTIDRPSTSNGLLTLPREKGLKKKRSLSSLLSAASEGSTNTFLSRSTSPSPVYRSPLGTSDSLQLSSVDEAIAKDDASANAPEEEKRRPKRKPTNNFVQKNTWLRRQNMKVHPYPLEATYMQAYEALQLEKCVAFIILESAT